MNHNLKYHIPCPVNVQIGTLELGSLHPVVLQSMANVDTNNTEDSIKQAVSIAESGAAMVRFTTQGLREVKSLERVKHSLLKLGHNFPVVADVHFSSKIAIAAAAICDKVRINPGNFNEKKAVTNGIENSSNQDQKETVSQLLKLIETCKSNHTAIRIGVNHGSLSDRIMELYGDTPKGMVVSAKEFLKICKGKDFNNVVVSLKSSNSALMTKSVRLLVKEMIDEELYYPVHLGVTEAGDGLEGRIKSTVGIAPLLLEGIGNTIRVSLTEPPENELPVARLIVELFPKPEVLLYNPFENLPWDPFSFIEFRPLQPDNSERKNYPLVIASSNDNDPQPDIIAEKDEKEVILKQASRANKIIDLCDVQESTKNQYFVRIGTQDSLDKISTLKGNPILILENESNNIHEIKSWLINFHTKKIPFQLIFHKPYSIRDEERFAILSAGEFGFLLIDQMIDGVWIENSFTCDQFNTWLSFKILQASGTRKTTTDYIACPSCGRTLFDIQSVLADVKKATSHLKGLKIAVMGCIVNGPGEMADADYGYIGAGKGLVNIYKGKKQVRKNVPEKESINALKNVIKENGDWKRS